MSDETIKVPSLYGKPRITNQMKADCIGEFSFEIVDTIDEDSGAETFRDVDVPWDTCKEIYKQMVMSAKINDN